MRTEILQRVGLLTQLVIQDVGIKILRDRSLRLAKLPDPKRWQGSLIELNAVARKRDRTRLVLAVGKGISK